jgi:glycosyltransferase involved in cell wall biosynthesis
LAWADAVADALVLAGNSFVGSHLRRALRAAGRGVVATARHPDGAGGREPCDVTDRRRVEAVRRDEGRLPLPRLGDADRDGEQLTRMTGDGSMAGRPLRILQVNSYDIFGGAAKISWDLFQAYRDRGHFSHLAVGYKKSDDPDVFLIPNEELLRGKWSRFWRGTHPFLQALERRRVPGASWLRYFAGDLPGWKKQRDWEHGVEDFRFPGTWRLLTLTPQLPDVLHCHNLHGGYFDLRALPWLSRRVPVVLSLHDSWLVSGACSASLHCERWKTGCGECPLLSTATIFKRDATASNWRRKQRIYARSRLHVVTACRWMMHRVEQSMLAPAVVRSRVIPSGVDLSLFRPGDRCRARAELGLPPDARVFLFVGHFVRGNWAKDFATVRAAVALLGGRRPGQRVLLLARGEDAPPEQVGSAEVRYIPFESDPRAVVPYYQAADLYLHAAHIDTFPNVILEALACGTPVVATGVGGIPEQVRSLTAGGPGEGWPGHDAGEATGALVGPRDPEALAAAVGRLLDDEPLRRRLAANAARDARLRFDLRRHVDDHLAWYEELLCGANGRAQPGAREFRPA